MADDAGPIATGIYREKRDEGRYRVQYMGKTSASAAGVSENFYQYL
jgi:hypothetical protein